MSEKRFGSNPESVLVRIKEEIRVKLGISIDSFKYLIDRYVTTNVKSTSTKAHFTKVNMYNEINSDRMTFKVFFKFLRIIGAKEVIFNVQVVTARGRKEEVSLLFRIPGQNPEDYEVLDYEKEPQQDL